MLECSLLVGGGVSVVVELKRLPRMLGEGAVSGGGVVCPFLAVPGESESGLSSEMRMAPEKQNSQRLLP